MSFTEKYCSVAGGGAHDGSTAADAWTFAEAIAGVAAGNRVNMIAGTYVNTVTGRSLTTAGTAIAPIWWRGYKTTIGDQDNNNVAVAGTDIPAITFTTGQFIVGAAHQILSSLDIAGACTTAGGQFVINGTPGVTCYRVRCQNTAANAAGRAIGTTTGSMLIACYFKATTTATICVNLLNNKTTLFGCVIVGGTTGVSLGGNPNYVLWNVFDSQAGDAMLTVSTASAVIANNAIYAPAGNGINIIATVGELLIANNYFENVNQASKAAINNTSGTDTDLIRCVGNAYFNCTATISGITNSFSIFDNGTLGSAAFIAPTSQNFGMLAPGQNLGYPGLFENTNVFRGLLDVGAAVNGHANRSRSFSGF